ncbi:suppressor of fused domain protein [Breznakia pachnodae]|uniref:Suppressor of fused-like domain-containing protein n=1 Tax=Breznakia pachnodae TaxID=265178 RepID=A0ABU0E448_9FIRM|nr:suppressor of fused domain protein [Breznakia pachnodae]MDQ0361504.1 hypothetical protein [Breznakia pachnodae]
MSFFKRKKKEKELNLELYSDQELEQLDTFISEHFGSADNVFHEIVSPDIHLDIGIIAPTSERNYYTLVTMGMGAHKMNIPPQLEGFFGYAELMIVLPPDWKIEDNSEEWYWPIRLLKGLARLPINCDTWLGFGHTIDNQGPFADTTNLSSSMLVSPFSVEEKGTFVDMDSKRVHFYQIIPLYNEEVNYKLEQDAESLLELMKDEYPFIINPNRKNYYKSENAYKS